MDDIGGKPAWAWIFILEGLFTVLVGIASFWVIQDFPETAKFLTEEESWHVVGFSFLPRANFDEGAFVIDRLQSDQQFSAGGERFDMKYVRRSLTDVKTWLASS